jgi:hypothetical protein
MKPLVFLTLLLLSMDLAWAGKEHKNDSIGNNGQTEFNFFENDFTISKKDSVLVIYDRYDLSGAGVIKKIYYPGSNQTVFIPNIPSGKYFVTIQCLGKHHDRYEKIIKVKNGKTSFVSVKLNNYAEFTKGNVAIPNDPVDFSKLSIVTMK